MNGERSTCYNEV